MITTQNTTELGPALVKRVRVDGIELEMEGRRVEARWAVPAVYEAQPGDLVLAIGNGLDYYVIGVLSGSGRTRLTVPGDLEIRAVNGGIDLLATREVRIRAPRVRLHADRLEVLARRLRERFETAERWVRDSFRLRAGRTRTVVEGEHSLDAERIVEIARKDVRIDGERIDLG